MSGPGDATDGSATGHPVVVMLARSPFAPGKTRLTSGLTPAAAAALREALLRDTLEAALAPGWPLHVHVTPAADLARMPAWLAGDPALAGHAARVTWHVQAGEDLGARMVAALATAFDAGHEVALLVGSDIPDLPPAALTAAHAALVARPRESCVVFGPAMDGGFYLVAATGASALADACAGVTWSQPSVLADVTARLVAAGVEVATVTPWADVDDAAQLAALLARSGGTARRTREAASQCPPLQ